MRPVGIASPTSTFRSKVISTSIVHRRHFAFPTSGHVGSGIHESGMVENVGVTVEIPSVQKLILLPVHGPPF